MKQEVYLCVCAHDQPKAKQIDVTAVDSTIPRRHRPDRLSKLRLRLGDDPGYGLDAVDAAGDMARERDRGLHVAAEIEIQRAAELAHHVLRRLLLEARGLFGAQRAQGRAGAEAV